MNLKLGTITILTNDRQASSPELNQLLTDHGHHIMSRLGVNVQKTCTEHCTGLIVLAIEAEEKEIVEMTKKLNALKDVKAEAVIIS